MLTKQNITGLILAGGEGKRVGDRDKGLIEYQGIRLIERQIQWLSPQVKALVISANRNIIQYKPFGYPVVTDATPFSNLNGPLQGIRKGLEQCSTEMMFVQPVDLPNLPDDLIDMFLSKTKVVRRDTNVDCFYLKTSQRHHYLSMLLKRKLLMPLKKHLDSGCRKVINFHLSVGSLAVDLGLDESAFMNLNKTSDY